MSLSATDTFGSPAVSPSAWRLRDWQRHASDAHAQHGGQDFLISACPAAGKSRVGVLLAWQALAAGTANRVVVCAPTVHICRQWERAMHAAGLAVQAGRPNDAGPEPPGVHGVAITYQALAAAPGRHLSRTLTRRTFVIFDEPHHLADNAEWGAAARRAYGHDRVVRRLLLSGTPFRTDGQRMPFVSYGDDDRAVEDFAYTYAQAINDGVCRPLEVVRFEGRMRWASRGRDYDADFAEELVRREQGRRYRTALETGEWLPSLLAAANDRLVALRTTGGHPDAGGLVVAADQTHARSVASALSRIIGYTPVVVLSDEERANARIESFSASSEPWIVAVRMVSEGVDIPRLRVGVYATAARTEMHFRQVVGRFVRRQSHIGGEQRAYLYVASDPGLLALARRLVADTPGGVSLQEETEPQDPAGREDREERERDWIAHDSTAAVADGALDERGTEFSADQIAALRSACVRLGLHDDPVAFGRMGGLFQVEETDWPAAQPAVVAAVPDPVTVLTPTPGDAEPRELTISEQYEALRDERRSLVRDIARLARISPEEVNRELKRLFGPVRTASPKELRRGNTHARGWRDKLYRKATIR